MNTRKFTEDIICHKFERTKRKDPLEEEKKEDTRRRKKKKKKKKPTQNTKKKAKTPQPHT